MKFDKNDYPQPNEHFHRRLCDALDNLPERKETQKMKKPGTGKIILIAAALTAVIGASAFAGSGIVTMWTGSSSSIPDYTEVLSPETVLKDFGFEFVVADGFSNGYKFDGAVKVDQKAIGENEEVIERTDQLECTYKRGDEHMELFVDAGSLAEYGTEQAGTYADIPIYYSSYTNKVVPPDYELTDDDKAAQENGDLVFSYGSDDVEVHEVRNYAWKDNGLNHSILLIDSDISSDEIMRVIGEIIDLQK